MTKNRNANLQHLKKIRKDIKNYQILLYRYKYLAGFIKKSLSAILLQAIVNEFIENIAVSQGLH